MLRASKAFVRFVFLIEATVLLAQTIYTIRHQLYVRHRPLSLADLAFHAIVLTLAALFAAAWYRTRRPRGRRSIIAVVASAANTAMVLLVLSLPFLDRSWPPLDFTLFNLALLIASLVSIYVFLVPASESSPAPCATKFPRIPGDCTRPWFDHCYTVLFIAIVLVNWHLWDGWAAAHRLPSVMASGLLLQLASFTLADIVIAAIHESGHALAALILRMKLLSFTVGPFQWRRYQGRWTFSFHLSGLVAIGGGVNVVPIRGDMSRSQDALIVAAGPLANLLTAPMLFWIALHTPASPLAPAWLFFAWLAGFSVLIGAFNLFPLRATSGSYSDGARLLQLASNSPVLALYQTERRLQSTLVTSLRYRDLDPAALERAAALFPRTATAIRYHLCAAHAHEDAGRIADAAQSIAAAEAIYNENAATIDLPAVHHLGFITFHAMHSRNSAAARLWQDRMSAKSEKPAERRLFTFDRALAAAALAFVEARSLDAQLVWRQASRAAESLPRFGAYHFDRDTLAYLRALLDSSATGAPATATVIAAGVPALNPVAAQLTPAHA